MKLKRRETMILRICCTLRKLTERKEKIKGN